MQVASTQIAIISTGSRDILCELIARALGDTEAYSSPIDNDLVGIGFYGCIRT